MPLTKRNKVKFAYKHKLNKLINLDERYTLPAKDDSNLLDYGLPLFSVLRYRLTPKNDIKIKLT